MTAFLQLVNRIQSPARSLTKLVPAFVSVFTAAERLMELEENPLDEQGDPVVMEPPCGIRLEHVSYAYDDGDGDANTLEVLVSRLRKKLDPDGSIQPVTTIRRQGYIFNLSCS